MSNEVISENGEEAVVREDTAKAFRWNKFIGIVLLGIILIMIVFVVFFSGVLKATDPNLNPSNTTLPNRNSAP